MKFILIIHLIMGLTGTFGLNAQKSLIVSGYGGGSSLGDFTGKEALFIQEKARISFFRGSIVDVINLTEESAEVVGNQRIGVVFIDDAAVTNPILSEDVLITLEIFPIKESNPPFSVLAAEYYKMPLYFCKRYEPQNSDGAYWIEWRKEIERDITDFLQHPPVGDTLNFDGRIYSVATSYTDSRYTPLLIKNLTNDGEIHLERMGHVHLAPDPFTGIGGTESVTHYSAIRVSDFARGALNRIFRSHETWRFTVPDSDASAEEWQIWLDELLNNEIRK